MAEISIFNKAHHLYTEDLETVISVPGFDVFNNKTFLITGATGLVGLCLVDALMLYNRRGGNIHICAVGRNKEKAEKRFGKYYYDRNFTFIVQDVRVPFNSSLKADFIIPLASNTHPSAYSHYPIETIEINVKGAENALRLAVENGATVLYPSTVEVYGNSHGDDVFTEDYTGQLVLSNARSCYTESKRVSEAMCQSYIAEKGCKVKIVRLSRIFGPTMLMTDTKASSQFIIKALNNENIVLKSEGKQYFSYTYVADAIRAMFYVLLNGENGVVYNIASETCNVHLKDFAERCAKWANQSVVYDLPSEIERNGFSVAMRAILDNTRLKSIGWEPIYDIQNALDRTLTILKDR